MKRRLRWGYLGYVAAAGLWISTVTYAAVTTFGILGPTDPGLAGDLDSYIAAYLAYRRDLFAFEQVENWTLALALIAIAVLAELWRLTAVDRDDVVSRVSASVVMVGALIAAVTQVAYLGALDRVLVASTVRSFDPAPLGTMVDAIGRTDDYLENLGFLLIAAGLLGMARRSRSAQGPARGWRNLCLALSLGLLAAVATSFAASAANDAILLVAGAVLAPLWAIRLAHLIDKPRQPHHEVSNAAHR